MEFTPKIIYFLCAWCGSGGSETAAAYRLKYPENVRPFRVMCTGALDPVYILRCLIEGADGVVVSGCHPGDCHYNFGNFRGRRRIAIIKRILDSLGLDGERLWLRWVAHGEGKKMVDTAKEFNNYIIQKGVNPLSNRWDT
ncbi:MAG: hydrogenase iron-sulfur subunit [Methanophagales archaeon]|uniref:Hydrogenase iron-sulfur subunit n=1 Tax=Desulfofervidus auxilii TaxID=1621989 RepID=A0A7C1ZT49_DESA2|nr:hydrogenase iron-sulfur subunit [Methanophagales archaeon]MDL1965210.1 hydrogenase iron-sulfur subunit [Candidatus Desulfofervidus auxilii]CAD7769352.1 MAG: Methyl-viologen-reducing hydrogenase, delta subunit [Candidatus Methanoperedenaceae archaeon GB50]CAD7782177.1 Methyl-viologen-reducing hydrogenase, delta subunit [Candidatus Methanoperedenaceae archaeon GB37]CAD7783674.1 MAG: Methyl-viologen-reducing hydrogenase, delta subunit [Candidatus Methanoperedenaceae archaeon GB37]